MGMLKATQAVIQAVKRPNAARAAPELRLSADQVNRARLAIGSMTSGKSFAVQPLEKASAGVFTVVVDGAATEARFPSRELAERFVRQQRGQTGASWIASKTPAAEIERAKAFIKAHSVASGDEPFPLPSTGGVRVWGVRQADGAPKTGLFPTRDEAQEYIRLQQGL